MHTESTTINSLAAGDNILLPISWSAHVFVRASCLVTPTAYLNQRLLITKTDFHHVFQGYLIVHKAGSSENTLEILDK